MTHCFFFFLLLEETKWLPPFLQLSVVQKRLFSWTFPAGTQARTPECTTPGGISTNWVNGGQNIKTFILLSVMENYCTRWVISVVKAWLLLLQFLSFPSLMESDCLCLHDCELLRQDLLPPASPWDTVFNKFYTLFVHTLCLTPADARYLLVP